MGLVNRCPSVAAAAAASGGRERVKRRFGMAPSSYSGVVLIAGNGYVAASSSDVAVAET